MNKVVSNAEAEFYFGPNGEMIGFILRLPPKLADRVTRTFSEQSALTVERTGNRETYIRVD